GDLLPTVQAQHGGPITLAPGASFTFTVTTNLTIDGGEKYTNVVTVGGDDDEGSSTKATDDHTVAGADVAPSIIVTKSGPLTIAEGGAPVTYTFVTTNTSGITDPVTITAISDNKFGDLLGVAKSQNGGAAITLAPGASFTFTYTTTLTLDAAETHTNVVTVSGVADESSTATATDDHVVVGTNLAPSIPAG